MARVERLIEVRPDDPDGFEADDLFEGGMNRALTLMEMLVALALILALTVAVGSFAETYRQGRDFAVSEAYEIAKLMRVRSTGRSIFLCRCQCWRISGGTSGQFTIVGVCSLPWARSNPLIFWWTPFVMKPVLMSIQEIFTARSSNNTLTWRSTVSIVQLRYHDGSNWTDSWSVEQGLPLAIECKLWYEFDPEPEAIETAEGTIEADVPTLEELEWPRPDRHRIFAPVDPTTSTGSFP